MNVNLVDLDATVKSKDGRIMADLKKEDFEVREDGVAKKIELGLAAIFEMVLGAKTEIFLGPCVEYKPLAYKDTDTEVEKKQVSTETVMTKLVKAQTKTILAELLTIK